MTAPTFAADDALFAAIDQLDADADHEEALHFDAVRTVANVDSFTRAMMRSTLTAQGVRMMQVDAVFAAYVLHPYCKGYCHHVLLRSPQRIVYRCL